MVDGAQFLRATPVLYARLAALFVAILAIDQPAIFLPAVLLSYLYDLVVFELSVDPYGGHGFGVGLEDFTLKCVTPALIAHLYKLMEHDVLSRALIMFLMLEVLTLALAPRSRPGRRKDTRFAVDYGLQMELEMPLAGTEPVLCLLTWLSLYLAYHADTVHIPFLSQEHCFMMAQLVCIGPAVQTINNLRMLAVLLEHGHADNVKAPEERRRSSTRGDIEQNTNPRMRGGAGDHMSARDVQRLANAAKVTAQRQQSGKHA